MDFIIQLLYRKLNNDHWEIMIFGTVVIRELCKIKRKRRRRELSRVISWTVLILEQAEELRKDPNYYENIPKPTA